MKKLVQVGTLFGIVALILLLAIGSAAAYEEEPEIEPEIEVEIEIEIEPEWGDSEFGSLTKPVEGEEGQAVSAAGTATRIDFEQSEDSALEGWYVVQEVDGKRVAAWYAHDGYRDSGWINDLKISREAVHVRVLYYPPGSDTSTEPTVMTIINHAPGEEYGWLARGMEHALEVEFPG
jgi:hypothetical protein